MGIQPSRSNTRIRTKRSQPVPTIDDLIGGPLSPQTIRQRGWDLAGLCCVPVTIGHFKDQHLVTIYKRHVGRRCAGKLDTMPVKDWRVARGLR